MSCKDKNFFRVGVKALIWESDKKERFLLSLEENGHWELLGGGLEHGESAQEGLAREIKEETGLELAWVAKKPSYFFTVENTHENFWQANIVYEAKLKNLNFKKSYECVDLRYFSKEEALQEKIFPSVRKFLEIL